jgi:hypothetical protein
VGTVEGRPGELEARGNHGVHRSLWREYNTSSTRKLNTSMPPASQ